MTEIRFNEVDVAKLNLGPDDVLFVSVKVQDELTNFSGFAERLQETFDKNKVVVVGIRPDDEIIFSIVKEPKLQNFCNDCGCGKKEQFEGVQND